MWEVKTSSWKNVHSTEQYTNMPDEMSKRSLLKQCQAFKQNCQVLWKFQVNSWDHRIETCIPLRYQDANYIKLPKCKLYQTKIMKYATHSLKKSRKAKQIQTIVKNIPYIFRKKKLTRIQTKSRKSWIRCHTWGPEFTSTKT